MTFTSANGESIPLRSLPLRRTEEEEKHGQEEPLFEYKAGDVNNNGKRRPRRLKRMIRSIFTSKQAAIFYAVFHTCLLYAYITFIFGKSNGKIEMAPFKKPYQLNHTCRENTTATSQPSRGIYNQTRSSEEDLYNQTQSSAQTNDEDSNNDDLIFLVVSLSIALCLGLFIVVCGWNSKHVRCLCVLVLPGIVAGRGRTILMTATIGFIVEGPITSINYNINQMVQSQTCMYETVKETGK